MSTMFTMHKRIFRSAMAAGATALVLMLAPAALAGGNPYPGLVVPPDVQQTQLTIASAYYGATRSVELEINKSMIVDLPAGVAEVVVSQPSIAAAIMRTRSRAIVQGLSEGGTNILFLDDAGRTITVLDLKIMQAASEVGVALQATLARVIPGSNIRVETLSNNAINGTTHFVLTGTVQTAEDKAIAEALAADLSDSDGPGGSLIKVIGAQQVMLQVTVSEIRRDIAKQLGINLSGTISAGAVDLSFNNQTTGLANGVQGTFPIGNVDIDASIRALEERGALRLLAQPTLTAISGQPAEFLVGGEVRYERGVDDNGNTIFDLREYGVKLAFTPTVKSGNVIGLVVNTEVSEPAANALLTKRQASTSVELPTGTTMAIGGLMSQRISQGISQIPGLGDIPILGALFRSRQYQSQETELVILVTPYLVGPSPANSIPVPTDRTAVATDAEAIFLGRMEKNYGVAGNGAMRGGFSGSVGFVLD